MNGAFLEVQRHFSWNTLGRTWNAGADAVRRPVDLAALLPVLLVVAARLDDAPALAQLERHLAGARHGSLDAVGVLQFQPLAQRRLQQLLPASGRAGSVWTPTKRNKKNSVQLGTTAS